MRHLKNAALGFLVAVGVYWAATLFIWQFYEYKVATVDQPIAVQNENDKVIAGEPLRLIVVVAKTGDYRATSINRGIICSSGGY